jgi:parvulin-like peptidyl-prolyl isomerase
VIFDIYNITKRKVVLRKRLLKQVMVICLITALAISIIFISGCSAAVAKVNGIEIKQDEVDAYIGFILVQDPEGTANLSEEEMADLEVNIIDSLLVVKLLEQYAEENGITVTQEEIDEQMNTIIASYPSENDFENDLKTKDIDPGFLQYEIKSQILRTKIYTETTASIITTEEIVKEYYEDNRETLFVIPSRVRVSHILSMFPWVKDTSLEENDQAKESAKEKIDFVEQQLENGAEFGDMAREFSDDTANSGDGGDLGFINEGQMVEEFEKAAFSLEVGEVSGIIETQFGYHILKVFDREEGRIQEYDEVKDDLSAYLSEAKKAEKWEEFILGLIGDAEIEYLSDVEGTLNSPIGSTGDRAPDETDASGEEGSSSEEDKLLDDESIDGFIEDSNE